MFSISKSLNLVRKKFILEISCNSKLKYCEIKYYLFPYILSNTVKLKTNKWKLTLQKKYSILIKKYFPVYLLGLSVFCSKIKPKREDAWYIFSIGKFNFYQFLLTILFDNKHYCHRKNKKLSVILFECNLPIGRQYLSVSVLYFINILHIKNIKFFLQYK